MRVAEDGAQQRALEALARLQAMDPHHAERAELQAAGVGEWRTDALFGAPFTALAPTLKAHVAALTDAELFALEPQRMTVADLLDSTPESLVSIRSAEAEAFHAEPVYQELRAHILGRYRSLLRSEPTPGQLRFTVYALVNTAWQVHWLMTHSDTLSPSQRVQVAELMLLVARNLHF